MTKTTKPTQTATNKGVEYLTGGVHGNHGNDENHENPRCKPRVPQTMGLEMPKLKTLYYPASRPWRDFSEVQGGFGRKFLEGGLDFLGNCLDVDIAIQNPSEANF